jgi:hypothetical protein
VGDYIDNRIADADNIGSGLFHRVCFTIEGSLIECVSGADTPAFQVWEGAPSRGRGRGLRVLMDPRDAKLPLRLPSPTGGTGSSEMLPVDIAQELSAACPLRSRD